jgi:hypothetical protein
VGWLTIFGGKPEIVAPLPYQSGGQVFFAGVVITALFAVPLVNLVAAAVATAFTVYCG